MKGYDRPQGGTRKPTEGGEGPGHTPSPPDSSLSKYTEPWTLDAHKERSYTLCLVWDSQFGNGVLDGGMMLSRGAAERRKERLSSDGFYQDFPAAPLCTSQAGHRHLSVHGCFLIPKPRGHP